MRPRHVPGGLLALLTLFVGLPPVRSADDVVQQIPDTALAYVVVKNLQEADGEVNQTAERLQLPAPNLLKMFKERFGMLKGVVESGDSALVLIGDEPNDPFPVLFVRTNDYEELLTALNPDEQDGPISEVTVGGKKALVAEKHSYAVFASSAFREGLKQVVESKDRVKILDKTKDFARNADLYAVATTAGVKTLSQKAITGLQAVKQQLVRLGPQGEPAVAAFEMYEELFKWAAEEVVQVVVTLQIDDNGTVSLAKSVDFRQTTEIATSGAAAAATKRLGRLPNWPYVVAAAGEVGDSKAIEKWIQLSMDMTRSMMDPQLTDEQVEKLVKVSRQSMEGLRGISFTFGVPKVGGSIYSRMGMMMEVDSAEAYINNYLEAMQQMQEIFANNERMPYRILTAEKVQLAGVPGMKIVMQITPTALGAGGEQVKKMIDKLYGEDGKIEAYAAPVDRNHVALAYVSEENLQAMIQSAKSIAEGLGTDQGIQTTAKLLPEDAQLVGYISPEGSLQFVQRMIQTLAPAEQQPQISEIPPFPSSPPLGFSFQYDGQALQAGLVAPTEFVTALGEYIQAVQKAAVR